MGPCLRAPRALQALRRLLPDLPGAKPTMTNRQRPHRTHPAGARRGPANSHSIAAGLRSVLELLKRLPGGVVLDLGCGSGTFDAAGFPGIVVRLDLERHPDSTVSNFIQADAAKLPFVASQFDLLISNNSLEHVDDLESSLREIGRVLKPSGALYVAVPDAGTLCDRL